MSEILVITGASGGIGRATVREFARRGSRIGLLARGRTGLMWLSRHARLAGAVTAVAAGIGAAAAAAYSRVTSLSASSDSALTPSRTAITSRSGTRSPHARLPPLRAPPPSRPDIARFAASDFAARPGSETAKARSALDRCSEYGGPARLLVDILQTGRADFLLREDLPAGIVNAAFVRPAGHVRGTLTEAQAAALSTERRE